MVQPRFPGPRAAMPPVCVLGTGDGSYLPPLGLRAVCEAQQVTEPVDGSHLSEQLRSCLRGWSGPSHEPGRRRRKRRRRRKSGRAQWMPGGRLGSLLWAQAGLWAGGEVTGVGFGEQQ